MTLCPYSISATLTCNAETNSTYCDHHQGARCVFCHAQATHNCQHEEKHICGCPLCDSCEHVPIEGRNGQLWQHREVGGEMRVPHWAREVVKV